MAIADLLRACPRCLSPRAIQRESDGERCTACGTRYLRGPAGLIVAEGADGVREEASAAAWLDRLPPLDPELPLEAAAEVAFGLPAAPVRRGRELLGWLERFGDPVPGVLRLEPDRLAFRADSGRAYAWDLDHVTGLQVSSRTLQLKVRSLLPMALAFPGGSPRYWEELLTAALQGHWHACGRGPIREFQPYVVGEPAVRPGAHPATPALPGGGVGGPAKGAATAATRKGRPGQSVLVYRTVQHTAHLLARQLLPALEVVGKANVPAEGPFLLVANHESILDPILIQAVCPRIVHTMSKSAQFAPPGMGWLMPRLNGFPVRRFQVDPQAVKTALRHLAADHPVGIYLEGERSWDGRLQRPRLGTLRLVLRAGVPVIPVGIQGAYEVWPRWANRPRWGPVRITFGAAIRFPGPLHDRVERERQLPATGARLLGELARLSASELAPDVRHLVEKPPR